MKLSKIYSNNEAVFNSIKFHEGLNVILGEIRLPGNIDKDSHNLGKSKLCELIDYCLLKEKSQDFFLFKHFDVFKDFIFFLEIVLNDGSYLTIRRSVESNTKVQLKIHEEINQDLNTLESSEWDYKDLGLDKSKLILDSILSLHAIEPWDYRTAINYALRSQEDFLDIFKLSNFLGRHINWKPYIGHTLGFNAKNLTKNYELVGLQGKTEDKLNDLVNEIGDILGDQEEVLAGLYQNKKTAILELQSQMDEFNFDQLDSQTIDTLTDDIEAEISDLVKIKYYLSSKIKKLKDSIDRSKIKLNTNTTKKLFEEAGVLFPSQLKRSYDELITFNRKINIERKGFVSDKINSFRLELEEISIKLKELNDRKSSSLKILNTTDPMSKYKSMTAQLISKNVEFQQIEKKLETSKKIKVLDNQLLNIRKDRTETSGLIRADKDQVITTLDNTYDKIKTEFANFIKIVLGSKGQISTRQNKEGNLDFTAGFIDENGIETGESDGHSYKRLLCIGYDLAVIQAYSDQDFIKFLYHDGGLETLDSRKQLNFIKYIRDYPQEHGLQYILTAIDSELPDSFHFEDSEICLTLHDDGASGRLFKMPSW
jgi:uncharacterized protein YydD (DUF2326 family)